MAFRGTYEHTVDGKGRVSLPAKHRRDLDEEVVVVPVPNADFGRALYVFNESDYDEWVESFFKSRNPEEDPGGFNQRSKAHIAMRRYLDASAESIVIDSVGRVKLSASLMEKVGIERDVCIVGQSDHVEIWDAGAYRAYMDSIDPFAAFLED